MKSIIFEMRRKRKRPHKPAKQRWTRRKKQKRKTKQKGGALYVRKPRTIDKVVEGMSMFLSGPAPTFASMGSLLTKQALKGIEDNVMHSVGGNKRRGRPVIGQDLFRRWSNNHQAS